MILYNRSRLNSLVFVLMWPKQKSAGISIQPCDSFCKCRCSGSVYILDSAGLWSFLPSFLFFSVFKANPMRQSCILNFSFESMGTSNARGGVTEEYSSFLQQPKYYYCINEITKGRDLQRPLWNRNYPIAVRRVCPQLNDS